LLELDDKYILSARHKTKAFHSAHQTLISLESISMTKRAST